MSLNTLPSVTGSDIIRVARSWVGTAFRHCGRNRHGIDCAGLLIVIAQELGLPYVDRGHYSRQECALHEDRLRGELEQIAVPVMGDWQPGDILVLRVGHPGVAQHLALWTGEGTILHAAEYENPFGPRGVVCETEWKPAMRRLTAAVYRWQTVRHETEVGR